MRLNNIETVNAGDGMNLTCVTIYLLTEAPEIILYYFRGYDWFERC